MYFKQLNVKLKAFNLTEEKCSSKCLFFPLTVEKQSKFAFLHFAASAEITLPTIKLRAQLFFFPFFFFTFLF